MWRIVLLIVLLSSCGKANIFEDNFDTALDAETWVVESLPESKVFTEGGSLVIDSRPGTTVWLNKRLSGNYRITYDRTVVVDSGKNDRLSDLNQFWMAEAAPFGKDGVFESYDSTRMYYMGLGANYNTTSRFRKYEGDGQKPIIGEKADFFLEPNRTYRIETTVFNGRVSVSVDGVLFFDYQDPEPLLSGYFGFRTTWSRHIIDFVRIEAL